MIKGYKMKCPKCKFDNSEDSIFCGKCCSPITGDSVMATYGTNIAYETYRQYTWALRLVALICFLAIIILPIAVSVLR
jgi:uncharacterized membrane protein YvbJ